MRLWREVGAWWQRVVSWQRSIHKLKLIPKPIKVEDAVWKAA